MKTRTFALIGLLLIPALFLAGCASGLTASAWPGVTADTKNAYVAGGQYVYAVNLETGAQTWRFPDKASANPFFATPTLSPDGKQLIVGGYDKKLYSLDPLTGKSTWTFTQARDRFIGGALVTDSMIYAPNADYMIYALDLLGNLKWTFEADQSIWGTPTTDGTNIYFGTLGRKVYAVNSQTGVLAWMQKVDGAVLGSPVMGQDKVLYVGTYGGSVYAMNTATGENRIIQQTSSWIWSGPVLNETSLYVGDANGKLYVTPLSGTGQGTSQDLSGAIIGSPVVFGENVIIGTESGSVYFLGLDGKNPRPIAISGKIYASPAAAGDLALVAPTAGTATLVALDNAGAVKWSFTPSK
jgi:eukaryotic-like serine/threonine-protein kinase